MARGRRIDGGVAVGRQEQAEPRAEHSEGDEAHHQPVGPEGNGDEAEDRRQAQRHAGRADPPRREARGEPRGERRHQPQQDGDGGELQPCHVGAVVEPLHEGEGHQEQHAVEQRVAHHHADETSRKVARTEQFDVDHRPARLLLAAQEQHEAQDRRGGAGQHRRRGERPDGNLRQGEHAQPNRLHQQHRAREIEGLVPLHVLVARARQDQPAQHEGQQAERHRRPENPAPAQQFEQEAAHDGPGADAPRLRGGEPADGARALLRRHRGHQERHAVGAQEPAAHALQRPQRHQLPQLADKFLVQFRKLIQILTPPQ